MKKALVVLELVLSAGLIAQTGAIQGTVHDGEAGRPLQAANILVVGTAVGTSSDKDGFFLLEALPTGTHTLNISHIGYSSWRGSVIVAATSTTELTVSMTPTVLPGQTIVVTSTRARQRETPVPFSTLEAKELARRYSTQDIPQLLSELPSTTFYSENGNGIGYNYLNIRGFDQRRISVMINGVPQNDPEDHNVYWLDFPDLAANLQDIQVQRGAGSAFYGPAAIGGSVNLITSSFAAKPSFSLSGGYGSYNTRKYSVSVHSGLLEEKYALQARLSRIKSDGYRENSWADFSSYFLGAVRYDEQMTTQLNFYGGPISDHLAYFGVPKADAYSSDRKRRANPITRPEEIENFSQPHYEFLHEWRVNDGLTVNNTVFFVTGEGFFDYDGSWAPYSYYRLTPQSGHPDSVYIPRALIRAWVGNVQYGWLPRLTLRHGDGELTIGAEARIHRSTHWGALRWGEGLSAEVTPDYHYYEYKGAKDIASVYAHETYRLSTELTLVFDVQYAYNKYRLYKEKYIGTDFSMPYHFLNPRLGMNYNVTPNINAYIQLSHTSREPRLKNLYDAAEASTPASWGAIVPQFESRSGGGYDFSRPFVKPERLLNFEAGAGYVSEGIQATVNFFFMDFRDEIIRSGRLDRFGQPITGNANKTRHLGMELTASAQLTEGLEIHGNMTISRNRLVKYTVYDSGVAQSLDGNTIAGFPDFLGNIRVSYSHGGLYAALSVQSVGEFYTDNFQQSSNTDPNRTVNAYHVVHGWIGYKPPITLLGRSLEARVQVNNLLNEIYASHGEGDDFFPAAERNVFATIILTL